jgi:hypothetical protein
VSSKRSATAAEIGKKVFAMTGTEVGDAAVQGSKEIVDALIGPELRFPLYLVQVALDGKAGEVRSAPPKTLRDPFEALVQRF